MRPWTLQAARSNLGVIVTMMREGDDPGSVQPPPEAIGYAKEYVVRGLELSLMQRAYRDRPGRLRRDHPGAAARGDRRRRPPGRGDGLLQRLDLRLGRGDRAAADRRLRERARAVGARRGRRPGGRGAGAARRRRRGRRRRGQPAARLRARPLPRRLRRLERGGRRAARRRRRPVRGDGAAGGRGRQVARGGAAADRRRGQAPRLLGRAPAASPTCRACASPAPGPAASRSPPGRRRPGSRASSSATARRSWRAASPSCAAMAAAPSPPTRTWRWRRCWPRTPRPPAASPPASSARSPPATTPRSASPRPWRSSSRRAPASSAPAAASASTPTPSPTASAAPNPCSAARSTERQLELRVALRLARSFPRPSSARRGLYRPSSPSRTSTCRGPSASGSPCGT